MPGAAQRHSIGSKAGSRASFRAAGLLSGLALVQLAAALLWGCGESGTGASATPPPKGRFEAVTAKAPTQDSLAGFCDVLAAPGQGRPFRLPALEGGAPPPAQGPLWLNVWATWCKPCIEEMPMIVTWQRQLEAQGKRAEVRFVSVDETAEIVQQFRAQNPSTPATLRLADPAALAAFVTDLGLDSGAGLPIHVFVEPGERIRCVRAGAITESHYASVASLL